MIQPSKGNLLQAPAEALVNTVNTEGVMGKGIALQFKQAYPEMFRAYTDACKAGRVRLGQMEVFDLGGLVDGPRWTSTSRPKGTGAHVAVWLISTPDWPIWLRRLNVLAFAQSPCRRLVVVMADWTGCKCGRALKLRSMPCRTLR